MKQQAIQRVNPSRLLHGATRRVQGIQSDVDSITLNGQKLKAKVGGAVIDEGVRLIRSIEAASTVEIPVADPNGDLRQSSLLASSYNLDIDDLKFKLVGVRRETNGDLTLVHEAKQVWRLRRPAGKKNAMKVFRGKWTRAEFVAAMINEFKHPRIPLYVPELHKRQPIEDDTDLHEDKQERGVRRDKGLDREADLSAKGVKLTSEQIDVADEMLRVAESEGASNEVMVGLITAGINESVLHNLTYGDRTSIGVLQLLSIHGSTEQRMSIPFAVRQFVNEGFTGAGSAKELSKRMSINQWLGLVMYDAGGTPYPGLQYQDEAGKIVEAFGGGEFGGDGSTSVDVEIPYAFSRGEDESTWAAMKRLGEEVNFRVFEAAGVVYYISEPALLASEPRMRVYANQDGVDEISWDYDVGRNVTEVNVVARAKAWAAPPGSVAILKGEGPADDRYIVSQIDSYLAGKDQVNITLKRPTRALPEPAPETKTKTIGGNHPQGGTESGGATEDVGGIVLKGTSPGDPDWGGAHWIFTQFVDPFMQEQGLSPGSRKRTSTLGNPGSDHYVGNTTAYATDYPTFSGEGAARALARAMGFDGWQPDSYASFTINADGVSFSAQILWGAAIDHSDHVHVGAHRA